MRGKEHTGLGNKLLPEGQNVKDVRIMIKGYKRPDGTYYISVPKMIRDMLELDGREYFLVSVRPDRQQIIAEIAFIKRLRHQRLISAY